MAQNGNCLPSKGMGSQHNEAYGKHASENEKHIIKKQLVFPERGMYGENTDIGKKMRNTVINWFKDNELYYDKIVFTHEEKKKRCRLNLL